MLAPLSADGPETLPERLRPLRHIFRSRPQVADQIRAFQLATVFGLMP